jgi:hypothetical protein
MNPSAFLVGIVLGLAAIEIGASLGFAAYALLLH